MSIEAAPSPRRVHDDIGDELFRAHFANLPWPAYIWQRMGDDFRLIAYNEAAVASEYTSVETLASVTATELYPPGSRHLADLWRCAREGVIIKWEDEFQFVSGVVRTMAVTYVPLSEDIIVVHTEDVTERRAAEQNLRRSEARIRALFASNPDVVFRMTTEGEFLDVHFPEHLDAPFTKDQLIGRTVRDFYGDAAMSEQVRLSKAAVRTKEVQVAEYELAPPSGGEPRRMESRFVASGPDEVVVNVRDVTERAMLERELTKIEERERNRVGRDLHDGLAQTLAGVKLLNEHLHQRLIDRAPELSPDAAQAVELLNQMIEQTRDLARGLSPLPEGISLFDALKQLASHWKNLFRIECRLVLDGKPQSVGQAAIVHLYRIAQEAVSNAARHGKASVVEISCAAEGERLDLRVADNGRGLAPNVSPSEGLGLRIMRYRARIIGGEIELRPGHGGGAVLVCRCARAILAD